MPETSLVTPALVEMWRNNLRKSIGPQVVEGVPLADTVSLSFHFGGGTTAVTAGQTGLLEVPFPARVVAIHFFAGSALFVPTIVTATVDIQFASQGNWIAGMTPLHAGILPSIAAAAEGLVTDMTDWTTALAQGDLLGARLATFSGLATFLLVSIIVRKLPVKGIDVFEMVDDAGDRLVDDNGNPIVWRS